MCLDAVLGSVGIPDVTVDAVIDAVTQPAGKFAFDGALGLILASRYPLEAREFQDFIDDSTSNRRGALYAEINLNDEAHLVNVRLGLYGNNRQWEATAWTRNLLDEEYYVIGFDVPVLSGFAAINAPPRTYGVTLNYRID